MSVAALLLLVLLQLPLAGRCSAEHVNPWSQRSPDYRTLLQNLTRGYVKRFRPVRTPNKAITIYLDLSIYAILDLEQKDEKLSLHVLYSEKWTDEYLTWNPEDYDGLTHFSLPVSEIWTPDIAIQEVVNEVKSGNVPYVSITFSGLVRHYRPLRFVVGCSLAIFKFPFDTQNCNLTFGPWLHTVEDVDVSLERSPEDVLNDTHVFVNHGEWELLPIRTWYHVLETEDGHFARLTFQVSIRRHPLFYVVNLIIPSALVMVIDITGFFIPPENGERIPFKITLLFGYTVFLVLVNDILPPFKDTTPMMGIYFVVCMAFLVLSVVETVLLFAIVKPTVLQKAPPQCLVWLASKLCCLPKSDTKIKQTERRKEQDKTKKDLFAAYKMNNKKRSGNPAMPDPKEKLMEFLRAIQSEIDAIRAVLDEKRHWRQVYQERMELMGILDNVFFAIYLMLLAAFVLVLVVYWREESNH